MSYKMDFVVVSYPGDFDLLLLQFRSISIFIEDEDFIGDIVLVWNVEESIEDYEFKYGSSVRKALGRLAYKLRVLPRRALVSHEVSEGLSGWRLQQLIKLQVSLYITNPHYCLLDSKNHFIKSFSRQTFMSSRGMPETPLIDYDQNHKYYPAYSKALAYFEVDSAQDVQAGLPMVTPFVFYTQHVRDIIFFVRKREGVSFEYAFKNIKLLSKSVEFLIYSAYIRRITDNNILSLYEESEKKCSTFFRKSPSTKARLDQEMKFIESGFAVMIGLHSGRISTLSDEEKTFFVKTWLKAKLFESEVKARGFLAEFGK